MNKMLKITLGVVAVAGIGGSVWALQTGNLPWAQKQMAAVAETAPVAVTANGKAVNITAPLSATKGKEVSLALANHSSSAVQLTIPGLYDTPLPVDAGGASNLTFVPANPGTYTIIEHGTKPNTRSEEGGTSGYEMEVGKVEVSAN